MLAEDLRPLHELDDATLIEAARVIARSLTEGRGPYLLSRFGVYVVGDLHDERSLLRLAREVQTEMMAKMRELE